MTDFPFTYKLDRIEIEYWVGAHGRCDGCAEQAEVRVGTEREWLLHLCSKCANAVGTKVARLGRDIRDSCREHVP